VVSRRICICPFAIFSGNFRDRTLSDKDKNVARMVHPEGLGP